VKKEMMKNFVSAGDLNENVDQTKVKITLPKVEPKRAEIIKTHEVRVKSPKPR